MFSEFVSKRAKEEREERLRSLAKARESFRRMLETSSLTARSSYRDAENLLKDDVRWKELDRGSREEEIRFFLQKLGDEEREVNINMRNND